MTEFCEASRSLTSVLAPVEKRAHEWIATRLPRWVNSDHLTGLALGAMLLAGLSCWLARVSSAALLLVETFLATYTLGTFTMSYFKIGPTELRILLAIGSLALICHPTAEVFGREFLLLDVGGVVATCGIAGTLAVATATHTRALYAAEPLPEQPDVAE